MLNFRKPRPDERSKWIVLTGVEDATKFAEKARAIIYFFRTESGLYVQGKQLYEKGGLNLGGLSDTDQAGVEADYEMCARMLERASNKQPG